MTATSMTTERPLHEANGEGASAVQPERLALSAADVEHFQREGYLVVEGVVTGAALDELRAVTDEFLNRARELDASVGPIDLSPDHTRDTLRCAGSSIPTGIIRYTRRRPEIRRSWT